MAINQSFSFVISHVVFELDEPLAIDDRHTLRAANDQEIEYIKRLMANVVGDNGYLFPPPYEYEIKLKTNEDSSIHHEKIHLSRSNWKYWVVAFDGSNDCIDEISSIFLLLSSKVELSFSVLSINYFGNSSHGDYGGVISSPTQIISKLGDFDHAFGAPPIINKAELKILPHLLKLYREINTNFEFVRISLVNFGHLLQIPRTSDLIVVGLFSIIESLITHAPRQNENLDSITHQISNKIIFLRKLYSRSIEPNNYFYASTEENIWKKLYKYRSGVAHGTPVNFTGELKVLRDRKTIIKFLEDNIIEIIKYGISNPQFLFDLRRC